MTVDELLTSALTLSPTDRATLIERLYTSLDSAPTSKIDQQWVEECDSRMAAVDSGQMSTKSAEDVFANIDED